MIFILFSDHLWFACYNLEQAKEMFQNHKWQCPPEIEKSAVVIQGTKVTKLRQEGNANER